jgi:molecular chaperone Hsp33
LPVRGALVRLTETWREALARRAAVGEFPGPVRQLLGEMSAAGLLMHSNIKFDGALVLQLHGDGPLKLAVVEVRTDLSFRSTAQVIATVDPDARLAGLANQHGKGRCAITLDADNRPAGSMPYQGIVPLYGDQREPLQSIGEVLEHYMLQSEQLDTRLVLAADDNTAAGLLLQRMPATEGVPSEHDESRIGHDEDFNRIATLARSVTTDELLHLDIDTLLRRLFWQEDLRRLNTQAVHFRCTCSRERVQTMLIGLGQKEIESIVQERDEVEVGCDFCGLNYRFDAIDVREMFTPSRDQPSTSTTLQ